MSDLIDRQAAIDAVEQMQMPIMRSEFPEEQFVFTGMSEALRAIKELPSAQQWIPCSERLPSEDGEYLVTRYAGYLPKKIIIDIAIYCRIRREWQKAYPVIAWMPLPEPYKGEQE